MGRSNSSWAGAASQMLWCQGNYTVSNDLCRGLWCLHWPWKSYMYTTFYFMAFHIPHSFFPIKPTYLQPWCCASKNPINSGAVILRKRLAPGHIFMCIPYIFLNFVFLLIAASVGPAQLHMPRVTSCPNTSPIAFAAWALEALPQPLPKASAAGCGEGSRQTFGLTCSCCSSALIAPADMVCLPGLEQQDASWGFPVVSSWSRCP